MSSRWTRKETRKLLEAYKQTTGIIKSSERNEAIAGILKEQGINRTTRSVEWRLTYLANLDRKRRRIRTTSNETLEADVPLNLTAQQIEQYLAAAEVQAPILEELDGITNGVEIRIPETGWFGIVYGSDWHIGNFRTQTSLLVEEAKIIRDTSGLYYIFQGDFVDGAVPAGTPNGLKNEQHVPPAMQRELALYVAGILFGKMKLICFGCHDLWAQNVADYDFVRHAAVKSQCPYLGGGGEYTIMTDTGEYWNGYASHRPKGHSIYNDLHPCVREAMMHHQDAEIITVAHEHIVATAMQTISQRRRYMARTSSRKTFDRFGSKLGSVGKRKRDMDVPVLILNATSREGFWIEGIDLAAKTLTDKRVAESMAEVAA